MDKATLFEQLQTKLRDQLRVARHAEGDAREGARDLADASEKRADSRHALEQGALASGHERRLRQLTEELEALARVAPRKFGKADPIGLGALVEIEDEEGREGRTFLVLPVGAGQELTGPDGDGVISVVTPASPIGRAVMGKRLGNDLEVMLQGEPRAFVITWVE